MRTKVIGSVWQHPDLLQGFEKERERHRMNTPHLTFDCLQAKCQGDRVKCAAGQKLHPGSEDGGVYLVSVLKGRTAGACKGCPFFIE